MLLTHAAKHVFWGGCIYFKTFHRLFAMTPNHCPNYTFLLPKRSFPVSYFNTGTGVNRQFLLFGFHLVDIDSRRDLRRLKTILFTVGLHSNMTHTWFQQLFAYSKLPFFSFFVVTTTHTTLVRCTVTVQSVSSSLGPLNSPHHHNSYDKH